VKNVWVMVALLVVLNGFPQISTTSHNLSVSGPGPMHSTDADEICVFCHTPHHADSAAPLWNRKSGAQLYTTYSSSSLYSSTGQPSGATKLCLSCHDGTIALGSVLTGGPFDMVNTDGGRIPSTQRSNLGLNLSDDHPVSFDPGPAVTLSGELSDPTMPVQYDDSGLMQCTTCHDPHDNLLEPFLVQTMSRSALCKNCHVLANYTGQTTHDVRNKVWGGSQSSSPWPYSTYNSVALNSCINCHRPHASDHGQRLLTHTNDEDVCLVCHDGSFAKNIARDLTRFSAHRMHLFSGHEPGEDLETAVRHVECVDCHHPHQLNQLGAVAPWSSGVLKGTWGRTVDGLIVEPAPQEHQVCLKCHGLDLYTVTPPVVRQQDTANVGVAIHPSNTSYHPLAAIGQSSRVPSLYMGQNVGSRIYCIDCHSSSAAPQTNRPSGPHGSDEPYILERRYDVGDLLSYSQTRYALCFKCHDPTRVMDGQATGFEYHPEHVDSEMTPCSVCHDSHGSPNHPALINFDVDVVLTNSAGRLEFAILGTQGECYLTCHGEEHNPKTYDRN